MTQKNTQTIQKTTKLGNIDYTFNVCYLREYMDPDHQGDFFYAYETIYRNVPYKYKDKFNNKKMKMKILKHCDWNYKDMASNFTRISKVELIDEDQYYTSYADVFGDTMTKDEYKREKLHMFNDYGQSYDRQSFRKDFNPELTYKLNPIKAKIEKAKGLH